MTRVSQKNVMAVLKNVLRHVSELSAEFKTEFINLYANKIKKKDTDFGSLLKYFYVPEIPLEEVVEMEYVPVAEKVRKSGKNFLNHFDATNEDFTSNTDNYSNYHGGVEDEVEVGGAMSLSSNCDDKVENLTVSGSSYDEDNDEERHLMHVDGADKQSTGSAKAKQFDNKAELIKSLEIYKKYERDMGDTILSLKTVDKIGEKIYDVARKKKSDKVEILILGCKEPLNIIMLMKKIEASSVKLSLTVIERNPEQASKLKNALTKFGLSVQTENIDFLFFDSVNKRFDAMITLISGSMSALVALKLCSLKVQHHTRIIAPIMIIKILESYKELNITLMMQKIDVSFATLCSRNITESQNSIEEKEERCWTKRKDSSR